MTAAILYNGRRYPVAARTMRELQHAAERITGKPGARLRAVESTGN